MLDKLNKHRSGRKGDLLDKMVSTLNYLVFKELIMTKRKGGLLGKPWFPYENE